MRPSRESGGSFALIRPERPDDIGSIRAVNIAAFDTDTEADLVDALREGAAPVVSLVAERGDAIVGHILFSPVTLTGRADLTMMGLAPMAVVPAEQRRGIGAALIRAGLASCKPLGAVAVVVLGHAAYYPRFGFAPAFCFGLRCEYDVPVDAFMALELEAGVLTGATGTVRYHPLFATV